MAAQESAGTILKILNGVQSGVDVALLDGTYVLGSGDDDDIQIFDVSLKAGHAKLRIGANKIELAGASGSLRTRNGAVLEAGGDFTEIEQLDVVSAGTTRFALGARTANWASITDEDRDAGIPSREPLVAAGAKTATLPWWRTWQSALPAAAVLLLAVGGLTAYPLLAPGRQDAAEVVAGSELDAVRGAVAAFDFARALKVDQEVDGAIFVTGFVDTPVQRRAVVGAVKDLNIPVRVRVAVRDVIRDDVASLIEAGGYKVSSTLSDAGELTLSGVVLDPKEAADLVGLMRDRVIGVTAINSQIRTAPTLLEDAKKLAGLSQIEPLVLLRQDGDALLEASGVIPTDKIDAWVGFLQAYSNQFADLIPLRSLVRLQNPDGSIGEPGAVPGTPLYLGSGEGVSEEDVVDVDRLRSGKFALSDIFVNKKPADASAQEEPRSDVADGGSGGRNGAADGDGMSGGGLDLAGFLSGGEDAGAKAGFAMKTDQADIGQAAGASSLAMGAGAGTNASGAPVSAGLGARTTGIGVGAQGAEAGLARTAGEAASPARAGEGSAAPATVRMVGGAGLWTPTVDTSENRKAESLWTPASTANKEGLSPVTADGVTETNGPERLGAMARELLGRWSAKSLGESEAGRRLSEGMAALDKRREGAGSSGPQALADRYALLLARARTDAMSGDSCWPGSRLTKHTVADALFWLDLFSVSEKLTMRDLGADLQSVVLEAALNPRQTTACAIAATGRGVDSVYLYEVSRNRDFVNFITRDFDAFPLDVAGVNLLGDRFIQTRDGRKMSIGYAPDQTARVALVGELGVVVERSDGYSTSIFGPGLNWSTQ